MERLRQRLYRRSSSSSSISRTPSLSPDPYKKNKKKRDKKNLPPPVRRVYITSDTRVFDESLIRRLESEGFEVKYLPFLTGTGTGTGTETKTETETADDIERDRKDLEKLIHEHEDDLEPGERYALVAYNRPAYLLLLSHHQPTTSTNPFPLLCAFVAICPNPPESIVSVSPPLVPHSTTSSYSSSSTPTSTSTTSSSAYVHATTSPVLPIQIHLASHQSQALWEDYNNNTHGRKRHQCHLFFYPESEPGFVESSSPVHDRISSRLVWSRSLDCLKRGFGWPAGNWSTPNPEFVWERYWRNIFRNRKCHDLAPHAEGMLEMMVGGGDPDSSRHARVHCVPNKVGGSTTTDIFTFYSSQFIPSGPPSQHIRLLSRTVGPDRVVDELLLSFTHTEEIPWLLPQVPPTGRSVRIPLVMTVSFRAGKIDRHNIYWDQASVLVQIGLLDPTLVPPGFQSIGTNREGRDVIERIPVVGAEAADAVLEG